MSLWIGTLLTTGAVIVTGAMHFDSRLAFDFPPGAFDFSLGFLFGLGAASRVGVYDYLGYYDICYIGDEVKDPGRVIPRSIIISVLAVAAIYFAINLSIIGVVPWREFVPYNVRPGADFVVSTFMEKSVRFEGCDGVYCDGVVDCVRIGLRAAAWVLTHSVCRRSGWIFLQVLWPDSSEEELSVRIADCHRDNLDRVQLLFPWNSDRRADNHADSDSVHWPDLCCSVAQKEQA